MNAATDDPMFFTPTDLFEVPMAPAFASHSNNAIPPSFSSSDKFQYPLYPSSLATERSYEYSLDSMPTKSRPAFLSDHFHQQPSTPREPFPGSSTELDANLAYPSSVAYMDASSTSWMMDSLNSTYLPDLSHSLGFYEENQNDENAFPYQWQPPGSQEISSTSAQWLPPSYSPFDSVHLPSLDDDANFNCSEPFPYLPHSFTNHEAVGQEVQSFLGYMPRVPSPMGISHACPDPPSTYTHEDMDDFSDSDTTTTSTQSWMIPLSHVPRCPDNDSLHPIGGMASSISTPVFGFDHSDPFHQPNLHHDSHQQQSKRKKQPTYTKQKRVHRSTSSHAIYASGATRKKTTMNHTHQRNEWQRRASDQYLLSTSKNEHDTTCLPLPSQSAAAASLSTSESISSLLSRQKLLDLEDEELDKAAFGHHGHHHHGTSRSKVDQRKSSHTSRPASSIAEEEQYHQDNTSGDSNSGDDKDASVFKAPSRNPAIKKGRNVDKACNHCKRSHLRCDSMRPCRRCIATGKSECRDVEHKPRGRPRLHGGANILL